MRDNDFDQKIISKKRFAREMSYLETPGFLKIVFRDQKLPKL
jgi:hypothetical protein